MNDLEKYIQQKVTEALEGSFMDAQVFGVGFIKIQIEGTDITVDHIPLKEIEQELQKVVEQKKFLTEM
jgi:hypothetical protein